MDVIFFYISSHSNTQCHHVNTILAGLCFIEQALKLSQVNHWSVLGLKIISKVLKKCRFTAKRGAMLKKDISILLSSFVKNKTLTQRESC